MRILHTADLHLGRQLHGYSLAEDHQIVLDQIVAALETHQPDIFIIAGDIFDRPAPPVSARRQFNHFLTRVRKISDAAVVMIAGNHDSGDGVEAMAIMADPEHDLIRGTLRVDEQPLILRDAEGKVAVSAFPFAFEHAARECFGDDSIASPEDVIRAQIAAAKTQIPAGARWIIVAHAFVAGGESSDSEKALTHIGGIEYVSQSAFEGAHYVALGHLHRPQMAGREGIQYSGAPLALGFDESGVEKSMILIELNAEGNVQKTLLPFTPQRQLRTLRGLLVELLNGTTSEDYIKIVLTDNTPQIDPMKRLRVLYPNACLLTYERDERAPENKSALSNHHSLLDDPINLISAFLLEAREEPTRENETSLIAGALSKLNNKEHQA